MRLQVEGHGEIDTDILRQQLGPQERALVAELDRQNAAKDIEIRDKDMVIKSLCSTLAVYKQLYAAGPLGGEHS